jgi:hypothetical protein
MTTKPKTIKGTALIVKGNLDCAYPKTQRGMDDMNLMLSCIEHYLGNVYKLADCTITLAPVKKKKV